MTGRRNATAEDAKDAEEGLYVSRSLSQELLRKMLNALPNATVPNIARSRNDRKLRDSASLVSGIATGEEDDALQALHSGVPVPGNIELRFSRKPSFFAGPESIGPFDVLYVKADRERLEGMLSRSVRPVYLDGAARDVAFINHLRLRPGCSSVAVLRRLCAELYELHETAPVPLTLATISSGNTKALGVLVERPLKSFPRLFPIHELMSFTIPSRSRIPRSMQLEFQRAEEHTPFPVMSAAAEKSFFPAVDQWRWSSLRAGGLLPEHVLTIAHEHRLAFHGALWDQSGTKQVEVSRLSPALSLIRPFYNLSARACGRSGIPAEGEPLRVLTLSFVGVRNNSPALFRSMLPAIAHETYLRGAEQFVVTFSTRDPLAAIARQFASMCYKSTVYAVSFDRQEPSSQLKSGICYLDPGFL